MCDTITCNTIICSTVMCATVICNTNICNTDLCKTDYSHYGQALRCIFREDFSFKYTKLPFFPLSIKILMKPKNFLCMEITIYDDCIYINSFNNSINEFGVLLLDNIKRFSKEMNINEVKVKDNLYICIIFSVNQQSNYSYSHIEGFEELYINYFSLNTLIYGESWYNENGFYPKDGNKHLENREHNKKLLDMPLSFILSLYMKEYPYSASMNCGYDYHIAMQNDIKNFIRTYHNINYQFEDDDAILGTISIQNFILHFKKNRIDSKELDDMTVYIVELINIVPELYYLDSSGNKTSTPLIKYERELTSNSVFTLESMCINEQ